MNGCLFVQFDRRNYYRFFSLSGQNAALSSDIYLKEMKNAKKGFNPK